MRILILALCLASQAFAVSLDDKIGQLLMIGFRGTTVDDSPEIVRDILRYHIGGIILFNWDTQLHADRNFVSPPQIEKLIADLQHLSPTPLLVATDQEGGKVTRLNEKDGFHASESAQALGARDDVAYTARATAILAGDLKTAGINFNLAPVVDLAVNPNGPIEKRERSFSADPAVVIRQARAYIGEHRKLRLLNALKHFPGHGSSTADSHLDLPDVTHTWTPKELEPYRELIAEGIDAVMTAHIVNQHLDPDYPATLSRKIIGGILRGQLGFRGLVLTDDMTMKAIVDHFGERDAIRLALNAGADILLFGNNLDYDPDVTEHVFTTVRDLVDKGEVPLSRIDEAYAHVMTAKAKLAN